MVRVIVARGVRSENGTTIAEWYSIVCELRCQDSLLIFDCSVDFVYERRLSFHASYCSGILIAHTYNLLEIPYLYITRRVRVTYLYTSTRLRLACHDLPRNVSLDTLSVLERKRRADSNLSAPATTYKFHSLLHPPPRRSSFLGLAHHISCFDTSTTPAHLVHP